MVTRKGEKERFGNPSYNGFCCSAVGSAHLRSNTPAQDSVFFDKQDDFTIACVCDGHGGDDYIRSAKGSFLACRAAAQCLSNREFLEAMQKAESFRRKEELILQLEKSIIFSWNELVREDVKQYPFSDSELEPCTEQLRQSLICGEEIEIAYGTTLVCAIVTSEFFLAIQIGDGLLAISNGGEFFFPMPEDERCFGNVTSSICSLNALECARHYLSNELPEAIFLSSDGVDKSFAGREQLCEFYGLIYSSVLENGTENASSELEDFLPRLSKNGSGDDVSIAAIIRDAK